MFESGSLGEGLSEAEVHDRAALAWRRMSL